MVDMDVWEQIVTLLEDAEDAEEMKQARSVKEKTIPWKTAKKELGLGQGGENRSYLRKMSPQVLFRFFTRTPSPLSAPKGYERAL